MKITIESTVRFVEVRPATHATPVMARVWQGKTESGIPVVCLIPSIAVPADQDQTEFQRELSTSGHAAPSVDAVEAFPLRMLL